jgi:prevent-host-death family protein
MTIVSIKDAESRLVDLARIVETGETVVITHNGKPVFDLVPHREKTGLRLDAIAEFKRKHGVDVIFPDVPEDFDAPLAEDFLLKPLP